MSIVLREWGKEETDYSRIETELRIPGPFQESRTWRYFLMKTEHVNSPEQQETVKCLHGARDNEAW